MAQFPWDPKPEPVAAPPPAAAPAPAVPNYTQAQLSPPPNSPSLSLPNLPLPQNPQIKGEASAVKTEPAVKQEPGLQQAMPSNFPNAPVGGAAIAQARAMQQLQSAYGQRAAASINAMQNGMTQPQQQGVPGQPQQMARPGGPAQQPGNMNNQQYRAQLAAATAAQQRQAAQQHQQMNGANGTNGLPQSQLDGASDAVEGVLMRQDADGNPVELGRVEIDNMLHEQIAARAKRMEGGGLMLPLKQATKHRSAVSKRAGASTSQVDGAEDGDDDELDEDAINSDLDDDEVGQEDEEDDDEAGQIMLCMYDKVQRVKNKWSVTPSASPQYLDLVCS